MGRFTRPLAAVVFGGALIIAAGPAVFADGANAGRDGASDQRAVAVGTDAGSFDINSGVQAPDHPTTI
ncbi:MAG: hypothetical protein IT337_07940, partial [Thermomicrobiales bacterium]|nr:hypothetical protein [Thermomicrobiales bacterium]